MADIFVPPIEPTTPAYPAVGFSKTVTTVAATVLTTSLDCFGMLIQSSTKDDSNATMSGIVYVQIDNGSGTQVKAFELVQGETVFIPCQAVSQVKVITQLGNGWVRGLVYRATNTR